jgi:hypothetical protein
LLRTTQNLQRQKLYQGPLASRRFHPLGGDRAVPLGARLIRARLITVCKGWENLLRQLRLPGILETLEARNREALDRKLAYTDFLTLLIQDEIAGIAFMFNG